MKYEISIKQIDGKKSKVILKQKCDIDKLYLTQQRDVIHVYKNDKVRELAASIFTLNNITYITESKPSTPLYTTTIKGKLLNQILEKNSIVNYSPFKGNKNGKKS
jgi:hypothetical protein